MSAIDTDLDGYVDHACPPWGCSLKYGHGWDDGDGPGDLGRGHGRHVGENVRLYAREWAYEPDDVTLPSTFESPTISLSDDGVGRRDMTAEQARQHAAVVRQAADDLLKAADEVDRIEATTV